MKMPHIARFSVRGRLKMRSELTRDEPGNFGSLP